MFFITMNPQLTENLWKAIENNNFEKFQNLLTSNFRSDSHAFNDKGLNALHLSVSHGRLEMVKYLLSSKNLEIKHEIDDRDKQKRTPLLLACYHAHIEIVQYLLTSPLFNKPDLIHQKDEQGCNSLMIAAYMGDMRLIQYLLSAIELKHHANLNSKDKHGQNALFYACREGNIQVVDYLLDFKEQLDLAHENKNGLNCLCISDKTKIVEIASLLIKKGKMTMNEKTRHWLRENNQEDILKLFQYYSLGEQLKVNIQSSKKLKI